LPAEIIAYAQRGVDHVISLQPFGCIANQIVSKGVEKKLKTLYPQINLLSLDFDSGVSEVNLQNRLLLFIDKLKEKQHGK
jgi:predicted nucleotide-binding protein (sugar kinase/HSP70/actin superfamily)